MQGLLFRPPLGEFWIGPLSGQEYPPGLLLVTAHALPKPVLKTCEQLAEAFGVAFQNHRQWQELKKLREAAEADRQKLLFRLDRQDISDSIVGSETGLRTVMERVGQVSQADVPVLLLGETGSGKEVVARAVHTLSPRKEGPFIRVNCGAIPPQLIDSQLFGHERGSFTGAHSSQKGWFERADGGTLFLDEIAELPLPAQVRLLRILQDGTFERVGGQKSIKTDLRIVAATHRDLREMVRQGSFREDLWYRIAVFVIPIPPLRERREDIPALATHFALGAAKRLGAPPLIPTSEDMQYLMNYPWPGNIRELAAVIERAAILGNGSCLKIRQALGSEFCPHLEDPFATTQPTVHTAKIETLDQAMARHIKTALQKTAGRIDGPSGAAGLLSINPSTLRARMRKLGIAGKNNRQAGQRQEEF
ncbi:MAG: sigma-54 dependent transcriptional regulator [Syntrophotaleaceae bacterium]